MLLERGKIEHTTLLPKDIFMPIRGIIYDFGGVIMRTENRTPRSDLAQKLGVAVEELEKLVFASRTAKQAELGKISAHQHWQAVAQALNAPENQISTIRQQFFAGDRLDWELLNKIKERRIEYHIALLSNAFDDLRTELTGASHIHSAYHISSADHILDFFDEVIISAEVGFAKPDPRIYQCAATRLGVSVAECVFIDDFPTNIEGASRAGMNAIRFLNPLQAHQDLETILNANHA